MDAESLQRDLEEVLGAALPDVVIICGPPAAGKSTLAAAIAQATERAWLDKDKAGDRLSGTIMAALGHDADDRDSVDYRRYAHDLALRLLALETGKCLQKGHRAVVEAPFLEDSTHADPGVGLARLLHTKYGFPASTATIWVTATEDVRRRRMITRAASRDAAKLADWADYVAEIPELPRPGVVDAIVVLTWSSVRESEEPRP